jgi:hypothetical protein
MDDDVRTRGRNGIVQGHGIEDVNNKRFDPALF